MLLPNQEISLDAIKQKFNKAAEGKTNISFLYEEISSRLLERLGLLQLEPSTILDLGSGESSNTAILKQYFPTSSLVALDIAYTALAKSSTKYSKVSFCCGNAAKLPFKNTSFNLVIADCVFPWLTPNSIFIEINRVLASKGVLLFTTFGPDTLQELKQAAHDAELDLQISSFADMHTVADIMRDSMLQNVVVDREVLVITYENIDKLIQDLKTMHLSIDVAQCRKIRNKLKENYLKTNGKYKLTIEIVYGMAYATVDKQLPTRKLSNIVVNTS